MRTVSPGDLRTKLGRIPLKCGTSPGVHRLLVTAKLSSSRPSVEVSDK